MQEHAYRRDAMWLSQNNGGKHDRDAFHDIVNRFMEDGESEHQARILALKTLNDNLVRRYVNVL